MMVAENVPKLLPVSSKNPKKTSGEKKNLSLAFLCCKNLETEIQKDPRAKVILSL